MLITILVVLIAWWFLEQMLRWIREDSLRSKEALLATFVQCEVSEIFVNVLAEEGRGVFMEKEWARDLLRRLIKTERRFAETHPEFDNEPTIGRLIGLLQESSS